MSCLSRPELLHQAAAVQVVKPDKYNGDSVQCRGFILQVELYLASLYCRRLRTRKISWSVTEAVLLQRFGEKQKMHPVAFFARKLSFAEQNYDLGNCELLAVKLAIEEWRHWLVDTNHKNICALLPDSTHDKPYYFSHALFFTRFWFTISYRPGKKNTKTDTISRMNPDKTKIQEPDTILPSSHFMKCHHLGPRPRYKASSDRMPVGRFLRTFCSDHQGDWWNMHKIHSDILPHDSLHSNVC